MNCIQTYILLTILIPLTSCNERIILSDVDSLKLRYKVKSMDESFYIAHNSYSNIILCKKIYHYKYTFHHDCRYKSIEKNRYANTSRDTTRDTPKSDSSKTHFPFAFKEPEYSFIKYKYSADTLTTMEIFDKQGHLQNCINQKYKNKRLQSEEKYTPSNSLISKSKFWYNSENKLRNKTTFYKNGYRETNYTYSTNKKYETGDNFNCLYKFDIHGRTSNKKTYKGTTLISETSFHYNHHGELISTCEIDKNGTIKKNIYDYTYDSNNNWTQCVEYNFTGNIFVRKRKITYYN